MLLPFKLHLSMVAFALLALASCGSDKKVGEQCSRSSDLTSSDCASGLVCVENDDCASPPCNPGVCAPPCAADLSCAKGCHCLSNTVTTPGGCLPDSPGGPACG